jgi:Papain-like cysteine protease AvrRpt2
MGHISFSVPMIPQGNNPICWIACVAMVTSFKTNATHSIGEFTGGSDPSSSCIPDPNNGWNDLYDNLKKFGFTPDGANMSIAASYIEATLRSHGPFIIFVFVADFPFSGPMCLNMNGNPSDTHAVVVNGVDTDAGTVRITNPWGTSTPPADIDVIIGLMQQIADLGLNPAAFMP